MKQSMVIVGGGIGGLATALAAARAGAAVQLLEQAQAFAEVGAGIQLGPNVVRVLQQWGLEPALRRVAAFPDRLEVRSALTAQVLGILPLGERAVAHYGAPYATVARADLHSLLLQATRAHADVDLQLHAVLASVQQDGQQVQLQTTQGASISTPLLVGADGLWSRVRQHLLPDAQPRATGHLAFRAMVKQSVLPALVRSHVVTAWLGPKFHAVQYPVRGGEWLNVVVIVQGHTAGDPTSWDHSANATEIRARLAYAQAPLLDLIHAIDDWRLWALYDRPPMASASEQAQGRIALLGDAAHPMRPYLAQGAGMAMEDAQQLVASLQTHAAHATDVPAALAHYAQARWQRNARVQARAIRNGQIFHLRGPMRMGRDASLKLLGEKLLDMPWLYGYGV
ncbi:MAG: FAD-dependent oxidoreductase [Burkholderiales bacterium PBB3]|nr:MAG: FAD-dependent oxidoreductase [Burkholderiales bacterium PBB3]